MKANTAKTVRDTMCWAAPLSHLQFSLNNSSQLCSGTVVVGVPALLSSVTVVVVVVVAVVVTVVVAGSVGEAVVCCMQQAAQWSSKSGWSPVLLPGLPRTVPRDSMVTKVTVSFIFDSQNFFPSGL